MTSAVVFVGLALVVAWCAFTAGRAAERAEQRHQDLFGRHLHPSHGGARVIDQPPGERVRIVRDPDAAAPYDWDDTRGDDEGTNACR